MTDLKSKQTLSGHRSRLRKRFLQSGLGGFLDYEIIELLLTLGTPRRDCKQMAKDVISKFGTLKAALDAPRTELQQVRGIGDSNVFGLKIFQEIAKIYTKSKIDDKKTFKATEDIGNYLKFKYGNEKKEHFITLMFDSCGNLIDVNDISTGIINETLVHPREVFEPAIKCLAVSMVIAHNHPSNDLKPSTEDLKITQRLISSGELLGIEVADHLIFSSEGYLSLKASGLL